MQGYIAGKRGLYKAGLVLLIAIGIFIQLSGLLLNNDGSRYATQLYLLLFLPGLMLLLSERLMPHLWGQFSAVVFLALLFWVLLYAGLHPGSDKTFFLWSKIVLLLFIYVAAVAWLVRYEHILSRVLLAALVVAGMFAWLTLYFQFIVLDRPLSYNEFRWIRLRELGWRGFGDLEHPIIAGLYYSVFGVITTWFFLHFRMSVWKSTMLAIVMSGLVFYVLLTFSRGAWFALGAAGLVLLLLTNNRKSWGLLSVGIVLLGLAIYWFWPELQNEQRVGVNGRDLIWGNWISRFSDFWLVGQGAGADIEFRFPSGQSFIHAHSLYLQLWYEYGIVGISLFVLLLMSLLLKAWKCRTSPIARLAAALLVLAMVAMVSDVYAVFHRPSPYWILLWFPVGLLLGVQRPGRQTSSNQ